MISEVCYHRLICCSSDDEPSAKKSSLETDEDEPETSDKNKDFLRF